VGVTIGGRRYWDIPRPTSVVGAVFDVAAFHPRHSARDHLRIYAAMGGYPSSRVRELLRLLDLDTAAERRTGGFSTGMRQRLTLATALLADPGVLLLDEPGNGLDPGGVAWLRSFLRELADDGRTVLISSHVLSEMQQGADDVVVIGQGRLLAAGPLHELTVTPHAVLVDTPDTTELGADPDPPRPPGGPERSAGPAGPRARRRPHRRAGGCPRAAHPWPDHRTDHPRTALPPPDWRTDRRMSRLIHAEFRRLLATRMWWGILLVAALLGGGLIGLLAVVGPENFQPPMPGLDTEAGVRAVVGFLGFTAFVPAAIGTVALTSEYRHRTINFTFAFAPHRWRVLAAKLITYGFVGLAYGLVLSSTAGLALFGASAARGVGLGLPAGTIVELLARLAVAMIAFTVLGVGMGALIRHQVGALCVVIGYLYGAELLLVMIPGVRDLYPWLPGGATAALTDFTAVTDALAQQMSSEPTRLLSPLTGALVLFGYTALASTAALVEPMRRDIR
jgi:ABC-type transport system involved in multi-copper enzyme maturation permease subunit